MAGIGLCQVVLLASGWWIMRRITWFDRPKFLMSHWWTRRKLVTCRDTHDSQDAMFLQSTIFLILFYHSKHGYPWLTRWSQVGIWRFGIVPWASSPPSRGAQAPVGPLPPSALLAWVESDSLWAWAVQFNRPFSSFSIYISFYLVDPLVDPSWYILKMIMVNWWTVWWLAIFPFVCYSKLLPNGTISSCGYPMGDLNGQVIRDLGH